MNPKTLQTAINEAKRFIEKAEKVPVIKQYDYTKDGKESAACKRASLDLTRILADLRAGK